mgnify:CR=1 FL=1|tara:strand:- start:1612 stop:1905 length:294 start_codon:yes stop_codon:yes gene_type:complete
MNKKIYKGPYAGPLDDEMMNRIDKNMKKVNDNYWKLGKSHFPRTSKASYVNIMMECPDTGETKKHIMGPYSKNVAQSIMTDFLSQGKCCWVEEDWIR